MIAPRTCSCGEAMQWRDADFGKWGRQGLYVCHHCDEPCAGVISTARCPLCRKIAIKR